MSQTYTVTRDETLAYTSADFRQNSPKRRYRTKHGIGFYELNVYSLCCGYRQMIEIGRRSLELWREHGHYHVRYCDHERTILTDKERQKSHVCDGNFYRYWQSFSSLKEARECFLRLLRSELPYYWHLEVQYSIPSKCKKVWEVLTTEPSRTMALKQQVCYRQNSPSSEYRIRRVKILE